jgi:putative ABC transport system permease protein
MALSVLAIGLAVGLVVAIRLMNTAVLASFLDAVDAMAGRAALSITAVAGSSFPDSLTDTVAHLHGVKLAVPLVSGFAFSDDDSGELLTVHGVDFTHDEDVRLYHEGDADQLLDDPLVFLNDAHSVMLTREYAAAHGLEMGDTVRLITPTGVQIFTVRGLLNPQGLARALGGRLVVMDLYAAQRVFASDGRVNQIDVVLDEGVDVDATRMLLAGLLPAGLEIREPSMRKEIVRQSAEAFQSMLTAFGLLAVFAGFVICYGRLGAVFEARTWEVGLFRAVGLRRSVVFRERLKESVLLGIAGTAVGIPLGVLIAKLGLPVLATTTSIASGLPVAVTPPALHGSDILLGTVLGLGAAIAAALVPAMRTARTSPVTALTMRGREISPAVLKPGWQGPAVLSLLIAALIVAQRVSGMRNIGLVTTASIVLLGCLLATPLVGHGAGWLKVLWTRGFGSAGRMAASHLARHPRRTALVTATLGVGLGSVLMLAILGWSFEQSLVAAVGNRSKAPLLVTSAFAAGGYRFAPMSQEVMRQIERIPGVALVAAEQDLDITYGDESVLVTAFDPEAYLDHRVSEWPVEAGDPATALRKVADGKAIAVSLSFANLHGTGPGDEIELRTPGGLHAFKVAAVTSGVPQSSVLMSRDLYRSLWNDNLVSWIDVVPEDGRDVKAMAVQIASELGRSYRLRVWERAVILDYWASQARQAFSVQYVMAAVAMLLVLVGVGDTLAASVVARTREIGMMRAVGMRRSGVVRIVVLEAFAIAAFGLLLAGAIGLALGLFWVEVQFPAFLGWGLRLHVPLGTILIAVIATLVLCFAGAFLPSLRAARMPVTVALRTE